MCFEHPVSRRAVEQDRVAVRLPDRRQPDAPRPMQAKEDAARLLAANEDSLGDLEGRGLKFVLIANGLVDKVSKIAQVLNVQGVIRHRCADSSWMKGGERKRLPVGKNEQSGEGVSTITIGRRKPVI